MVSTAYAIMDAAFAPAIAAGPIYVVIISAIVISLIFSLIYRILVDKRKAAFIKTELKSMKEKMKKARERRDEKELKALMGNMLQLQNQQMLLTMKPTLASLVLVAVIYSWLSYMYADVTAPIIDNKGTFKYREFTGNFTVTKQDSVFALAFSGGVSAKTGDAATLAGKTWILSYNDDVRGFFARLGSGQNTAGIVFQNLGSRFKIPYSDGTMSWLWVYIIVSFPVTLVSRKVMGID